VEACGLDLSGLGEMPKVTAIPVGQYDVDIETSKYILFLISASEISVRDFLIFFQL
jgi:hypothetical protein